MFLRGQLPGNPRPGITTIYSPEAQGRVNQSDPVAEAAYQESLRAWNEGGKVGDQPENPNANIPKDSTLFPLTLTSPSPGKKPIYYSKILYPKSTQVTQSLQNKFRYQNSTIDIDTEDDWSMASHHP